MDYSYEAEIERLEAENGRLQAENWRLREEDGRWAGANKSLADENEQLRIIETAARAYIAAYDEDDPGPILNALEERRALREALNGGA